MSTPPPDKQVARPAPLCNTCGLIGEDAHDCALVLLGRCRWLILHYAHRFEETDKKEALPLVEQIAKVLTPKGRTVTNGE